jgi:hypothetical protein
MRCVEYVGCIATVRTAYKILVGKSLGKGHSGELIVNGRIILKCISGKYGEKV